MMADANMIQHLDDVDKLPGNYFWHNHRFLIFRDFMQGKFLSLMDFGAGDGRFVERCVTEGLGNQFHARDVPKAIPQKLARLVEENKVKWSSSNSPLDLSISGVDCITILDVMEHIEDDRSLVKDLFEHMDKGSTIFLTVPAYSWLWSKWDVLLGHKRRYERFAACELLRQAGFQVVYSSYFFSYLLPVAVLRRFDLLNLGGSNNDNTSAEFPKISGVVNACLNLLGFLERKLIKCCAYIGYSLPFGTSVLVVCRKP